MYLPWQKLKDHFVPSKDNTYRPHLLRRGFLIFFLSVSLAAEGFLVADLVTRQSGENFLASAVSAPAGNSFTQTVQKQFARLASEPGPTTQWILGGIATLLIVILALTFFVHLHIQPADMLVRGMALAVFVVSLIAVNAHFLSMIPTEQTGPATVVVGADATTTPR